MATTEEQGNVTSPSKETVDGTANKTADLADKPNSTSSVDNSESVELKERSQKLLKAKELYSHGSRNYLLKNYAEAADELSQVCEIYGELYGDLSDELGMPYLFYAKSLISLALDENKLIDVPDEADDDDDEDEDDEEADAEGVEEEQKTKVEDKQNSKTNGASKQTAATTVEEKALANEASSTTKAIESDKNEQSSAENVAVVADSSVDKNGHAHVVKDDELPSTSNGEVAAETADDAEDDAYSSLQLAWEILETAAKIFARQGLNGLSNLAEVHCELGNIQFENNALDAAREDYEKALKIYLELPDNNYRRAMAEVHYKIGLMYVMRQMNQEAAASLKDACMLIEGEIADIKSKQELSEKDQNNIKDLEETKQEIWAKIEEIEDTQAQNAAEIRAMLDNYIVSSSASKSAAAATSSSACSSSSATEKVTDITHLVKRKHIERKSSSEDEDSPSPAKKRAI